ncbi:MAG: hypothetical protein ABI165_09880, partial [Bryobacteraceae bacterium]
MNSVATDDFPVPAGFDGVSVPALLRAAALGHVGVDRRFVHAVLDRGPAVAQDLARFAVENHERDTVGLDLDLVSMFRHLRTTAALPFFMALFRQAPEDPPDELTEAIAALGVAALEPMLALYRELDEEQGAEAAFVLASLGVRDPRILGVLREQLEYSASEGAFLLGVYGDAAASPALHGLLAEVPAEDKSFRIEIQSAIDLLRDEPLPAEPDSFDIWELYPEAAPPPADLLPLDERLTLLGSACVEYRLEAATSFRQIELPAKVRDRLLEVAQTDSDSNVRGRAWEAL